MSGWMTEPTAPAATTTARCASCATARAAATASLSPTGGRSGTWNRRRRTICLPSASSATSRLRRSTATRAAVRSAAAGTAADAAAKSPRVLPRRRSGPRSLPVRTSPPRRSVPLSPISRKRLIDLRQGTSSPPVRAAVAAVDAAAEAAHRPVPIPVLILRIPRPQRPVLPGSPSRRDRTAAASRKSAPVIVADAAAAEAAAISPLRARRFDHHGKIYRPAAGQ